MTTWTTHHSWLHVQPYPGARRGPFLQRTQEGPCKPPAFSWDKRWNKSCVLVSARKESLLSCSPDLVPSVCFPKGLQVQPSAHKPRTSSCCRQALLAPPGLLSYSPWLICFSLFAASLQKCLLDISVWSTAVCLSSYFLLKMPDWLPEITKYCSHL